jgi:hypothetical protein
MSKQKKKPNIVEAMRHPRLFGSWFQGDSWDGWEAVLKASFALPMTDAEREFFYKVAERTPSSKPAKECFYIAGRRAGKDAIASLIIAHAAAFFDQQDRLRKGERALCLCLAYDREQAKIALNYTRAFFEEIPPLKAMVIRETANGFELSNGVDINIATNSFRSVRGRPILRCVMDELAYYKSEDSAMPDLEVYRAITPATATLPGSMIIGISSPYKQSGLLWDKYSRCYGRDDDDTLVIRAPSLLLNPTLDAEFIRKEIAADPVAKSCEWEATWRADINSLLDPALIDACIIPNRRELPPRPRMRSVAFLDAASGVGKDSMTLGIAYQDILSEKVVLACIKEWVPPFSPEQVCSESAQTLKGYGIHRVLSDRYSLGWTFEAFRRHSITLEYSDKSRSDLYRELLPLLSSGSVELLDNKKLRMQLLSLERRLSRGTGHETIDAPNGMHEDVANAVAGALVTCNARGVSSGFGAISLGPSHPGVVTNYEQRRWADYVCGRAPS